jgi:hypothetical protein
MCETNPIPRLRISDCGLRIGHRPAAGRLPCGLSRPACAGQLCETNPIPGGRDTRPFHCSIIPPFPAGPGGTGPGGRGTRGQLCETKPISAVAAAESPHYSSIPSFHRSNPRLIMRNKAKLGRPWVSGGPHVGEAYRAKQTQSSDCGLRETNPISRQGRVGRGLGDVGRGANAPNEPNSSIADFRLRIADSGQTCGGTSPTGRRARGSVVQTNPIGQSESCKTNPISRRGPGTRAGRSIVRNKPNFSIADCAKRTQFPPTRISHDSTVPLFHSSNPGGRDRLFRLPLRAGARIMLPVKPCRMDLRPETHSVGE